MAKKHKKKKKNKYPKLSKSDRFTYAALEILISIVIFSGIFIDPLLYKLFIGNNSEVIAFEFTGSFLRLVPLTLLIVIAIALLAEAFSERRPIFGDKNIKYENLPLKKRVYPVFDKRYFKENFSKTKIIKATVCVTVSAVLLSFSCMFAYSGFLSRWEVTADRIIGYNSSGAIKEDYDYSFIESYALSSTMQRKGTAKFSEHYPALSITIKLKNGEELYFSDEYVRERFKGIITLDSLLDGKHKTVDASYLDYYIKYSGIDGEEASALREAFS